MKIEHTEVLNDLVDYFLLADLELLDAWRIERGIGPDLATELTTTDSVDEAIAEGILLPMRGIENYPFTVIFRSNDAVPELDDAEIQFRHDGYRLQVRHGQASLFTWPFLTAFNHEAVRWVLDRHAAHNGPTIELDNGFYDVAVIGGVRRETDDPLLEFVFSPEDTNAELSLPDPHRPFSITWPA